MIVVLQSKPYFNFVVKTFIKNGQRVFNNPKAISSLDDEEDPLLLEDYKWIEPTLCRGCKSPYVDERDSLTCPCLEE